MLENTRFAAMLENTLFAAMLENTLFAVMIWNTMQSSRCDHCLRSRGTSCTTHVWMRDVSKTFTLHDIALHYALLGARLEDLTLLYYMTHLSVHVS